MIGHLLADRYRILQEGVPGVPGKAYLASDTFRPGYPQCVVIQIQPLSDQPKTLQTLKQLLEKKFGILQQLSGNDHIPRTLDFFEENQDLYLVQEFVPGRPLSQELVPGQPLHEQQVIFLLQEILEILAFVHQQGLIHRDIQPGNIIRRQSDGRFALINLGLIQEISAPGVNVHRLLTPPPLNTSPAYKPPEQLEGKPLYSSDLYALGMVGIQALTGATVTELPAITQPGEDSSEISWRYRVVSCQELIAILDLMTRQDIERRYQSATEVLQSLRVMSPRLTPSPTPPPPPPPRPRDFQAENGRTPAIPIVNPPPEVKPIISSPPIPPEPASPVPPSFPPQEVDLPVPVEFVIESGEERRPPRTRRSATSRKRGKVPGWAILGLALLGIGVGVWLSPLPKILMSRQALDRGIAKSEQEDYQSALDDLTRAIELNPNNAVAFFERGSVRLKLGDSKGALEDYDRAVQLKPDHAPAYLARGYAHSELGDELTAIADFTKAIELKPDFAPAFLNRCLSYSNLNQQADAIEDCTKAIQLRPNHPLAYQNRGLARRRLNDYQGAIQDFNLAIRMSPDDADLYYNRGLARKELGDLKGALSDFDNTIKLDENHALVRYDRALTYIQLGDRDSAIQDLQQAAKLCLDQGRTGCFQDAQYQLKQLQGSSEKPSPTRKQ